MSVKKINVNAKYWIEHNDADDSFTSNFFDDSGEKSETYTKSSDVSSKLKFHIGFTHIWTILDNKSVNDEQKDKMLRIKYNLDFEIKDDAWIANHLIAGAIPTDNSNIDEGEQLKLLSEACDEIIRFFSEFHFTPSYRFMNTLCLSENKTEYILNYFKLQNDPSYPLIEKKLNSKEWRPIEAKLVYKPKNVINKHLVVYFGPAGIGKTVKAMENAKYTIICSSDMTCKDLLQDFNFKDGKPGFTKTDLWKAIEDGDTICFDEINLLGKDTRQFLQGLTDGKETVNYLGNVIKIHPNFKIIGTMNLVLEHMVWPLSEALVDRCAEIKEFKLTGKDLFRSLTS